MLVVFGIKTFIIAHQILLVYQNTIDQNTGLLYHANDERKEQKWEDPETGRSSIFWDRALGWFVVAIVDIMDYFHEDHPQRKEILAVYRKTIDALLKVSDEKSGVWYQVVDQPNREGNYLEGSCSAMYTYSIAKGANKGHLPSGYLAIAKDSLDSVIISLVIKDADGNVILSNICGGAGLGGNPYRDGTFEY